MFFTPLPSQACFSPPFPPMQASVQWTSHPRSYFHRQMGGQNLGLIYSNPSKSAVDTGGAGCSGTGEEKSKPAEMVHGHTKTTMRFSKQARSSIPLTSTAWDTQLSLLRAFTCKLLPIFIKGKYCWLPKQKLLGKGHNCQEKYHSGCCSRRRKNLCDGGKVKMQSMSHFAACCPSQCVWQEMKERIKAAACGVVSARCA